MKLEKAFKRVVPRKGELEKEHISFNKFVENNIQHALYRDWPDNIPSEEKPKDKIVYKEYWND